MSTPDYAPPPLATPPATVRILLAEDNDLNQIIVRTMLAKWPLQQAILEVARNGAEALALIEANTYDLVLMDCQMPVLDGYAATRLLRAHPDARKRHLPVIAITASAQPGDEAKVFEAGMNDFIAKPFEPQQLFDKILRAIPPPGLPAYDLTLLREIAGDDAEATLAIIAKFLERTPHDLAELAAGVTGRKFAEVARVAHRMKSTARFLGLPGMATTLEAMETQGRDTKARPTTAAMTQHLRWVEEVFARALAGLAEEVKLLQASH